MQRAVLLTLSVLYILVFLHKSSCANLDNSGEINSRFRRQAEGTTCAPRVSSSADIICEHEGKTINCNEPLPNGATATMKCKSNYESNVYRNNNYVTVCKDGFWDYLPLKCHPVCGTKIPKTSPVSEHAWYVAIYKQYETANKKLYICGGSLISENVIVTAAHCVTEQQTGAKLLDGKYFAAVGKYYREYDDPRDTQAQIREIKRIEIPTNFRGITTNYFADIAVVTVENGFSISQSIYPVCIDLGDRFENQQLEHNFGTIVGFGTTEAGGNVRQELKQLSLPVLNKDNCFKILPQSFTPFLTADKFCAGYTNGTGICTGDGGSGLVFYEAKSEKYFLRGLASVAPTKEISCDLYLPAAYTQISMYLDIIKKVLKQNQS